MMVSRRIFQLPEAQKPLAATYWMTLALAPFPPIVAWAVGNSFALMAVFTVAFAAIAFVALRAANTLTPIIISAALVGQAIAFTAAFAGHQWQIDSHMLFFVILATVATQLDLRSLLATTAIVAVHHLSLTLLLPALVYPSTDFASNLGRTVMHAAIVLIETLVLALSIMRSHRLDSALKAQNAGLEESHATAEAAQERAEQAQGAANNVVVAFTESLEKLANQDLRCEITTPFSEEYDGLRKHFNAVIKDLHAVLGDTKIASDGFVQNAGNLARSANSLAQRTQIQVDGHGDASAAMTGLAETVRTTLNKASTATQEAESACQSAIAGGKIVQSAVAAMGEIEKSSQDISNIIQVIEDIAFQTNILALNAAVEAARAGDSGKGFAVVAAEVRALALSTSGAANEVNSLIRKSAEQVTEGSKYVAATGESLDKIVHQTTLVSDVVNQINSITAQQSQALDEMRTAMATLDSATQQNATSVSEVTAISQAISGDARALTQSFGQFTFEDGGEMAMFSHHTRQVA